GRVVTHYPSRVSRHGFDPVPPRHLHPAEPRYGSPGDDAGRARLRKAPAPAPFRERAIHLANQRRLGGWDHDAHPRPRPPPVSHGDVAAPLSPRPAPLPFFPP